MTTGPAQARGHSMPISSQVPIIGYVANGVTKSFAFPFAILSADDLKVKVGADVVTTGFSIAGVGDRDGGSVTFTDAPASLTPIILYREVTLDRTTDYQENGDLLAIVLDDDFDRVWMALQDQLLLADRAVRAPIGETLQQLPPASERALMALAFDAAGNPIVVRGTNDGGAALALDLLDTAPGKGAELVGFIQSGAGVVARTAQDKLRETVSVKDFGAVGDGAADDTAEIQAAIDYCLANGKALYVPDGKYRLTAQVNIPVYSNVFERGLIIHGEGWGSRFIVDHAGTGFYVTCIPSFGTYQAEFRDLYFTTGATSPDKIIHNVGVINTLIRDCKFRDATVGTGCVVNDNAYGLTLHGCVFWGITGSCAFYAQVSNISTYSFVNSIIDCEFSIVTKGVEMQGCNAFLVSNTVFQECDVGFYANPVLTQVTAFNITFDTCWFERNTTWDIQLDSDAHYWCEASIRNCQFAGFPPTFQCKIQLEQKSKITVEGTPSGNTVFVHGANDAAAVLIRATNFVQSGSYAWTELQSGGRLITPHMQVDSGLNLLVGTTATNGDASNTKKVLAGQFSSVSGIDPSSPSGVAVDLVTLPNVSFSTWLVTIALNTGNAASWSTTALIQTQGTSSFVTVLRQSSQPLLITTSGLTVRGTQSSGTAYSIEWNATRIA